jgi:hypothetical protein
MRPKTKAKPRQKDRSRAAKKGPSPARARFDLEDDALLDMVQRQTLRYFWDFGRDAHRTLGRDDQPAVRLGLGHREHDRFPGAAGFLGGPMIPTVFATAFIYFQRSPAHNRGRDDRRWSSFAANRASVTSCR